MVILLLLLINPPPLTHFIINKQCCQSSQDILRHWLVHISIYILSLVYFKAIIKRLSVVIHFILNSTDRIRVTTDLIIFEFHCLQHIISHSINHILICRISLRCSCTIWSGIYLTNNIIVTSSIYK